MFLFGLEYGGVSYPWSSATVVCLLVFGLITIGLFFLIEWKVAKYPLIPLHLFSKRSNIAALLTCFMHGFVFISGSYYLPFYFQAVLGASPILSGVYLFPFVISLSLMSAATGVFIRKTGQYLPPIWFGLVFMTLGFGLYIDFPSYASWPRIIIFQIIAGLGVGPNFQAPLIALQSLVSPRDIASATATFGFTRNLATSISVVIGGVIFQNRMQSHLPDLLASNIPASTANSIGNGDAGSSIPLVAALTASQRDVVDVAYTQSLQTMWIFYTVIALVGLLCSLAIGRNKLSKTHEVTKTGLEAQEAGRQERKEKRRNRKSAQAAGKEEKKEEV
jgi:Na+/melibiose symporter-like transporter